MTTRSFSGDYGRRSHHVSKAYGRYRKLVGVGERGQDFHALRHTFTDMMEGAGVAITIIQLLIGHSRRASMGTTAIYSKGERVNLRKAINKVKYPGVIMRLIRGFVGQSPNAGTRLVGVEAHAAIKVVDSLGVATMEDIPGGKHVIVNRRTRAHRGGGRSSD